MELIDSHSHIDAPEFDADRGAAIARARAAGITQQVVPAVSAAGFAKLRDICATEPGLHPAFGLHPMYVAEHRPEHLDAVAEWAARERPCAIGECGLDFYVAGLDAEAQRAYFVRQLELARDLDLPLVLHARRAVDEVLATLRRIGGLRGVVHSWSGSAEQARQLWKLGFAIGVGGPLTYPRATRLRAIVATMPLEHLLLETDSPDQPLDGHQGERNEPARLPEVLRAVAHLRQVDEAVIAEATASNTRALFRLPSPPVNGNVPA